MAFTTKVISTAVKSIGDSTGESSHESAVTEYLDNATITTLHSLETFYANGYLVTVIIYE